MTPGAVVLNVNDHVANLYMVSKMLSNAGFRVVQARTGTEALALATAEAERPEVIVLDVQLPDVSGFEVCRRLKADPATRDIKIIHTSATFITSTYQAEGIEAGADGYLTQPFEPQELVATVRALVQLRATERHLIARNEALVAADRRKDEFLAMLAHELRNPLAAIQLGLPLLDRHPPHDEIEQRARAAMRRQTALLAQLVDDLLDVSRVTRGKIELRLVELDLVRLVHQVSEGLRSRLFEPRSQTLEVALPAREIVVAGDAGRLEQILTNLLDNASKYSDPGTRIDLGLRVEGGEAVIVVADRGIGIDAATLPAVFDLFAQASRTLDRSNGGLGIGLTLVKGLVQLHRGSIAASSPGIGKGTTITLRFPIADAAVAAPAPAAKGTAAPCRVLLIDDNDDGRELLRYMCELQGHVVSEARDGLAGAELAIAEKPDVAFVDIGLPELDGYEVARRVRAATGRATTLIALSGYGSPEHRRAALEAGFDDHIAKPIDLERLRAVVASVKPA